jgi:hypothetical protein
MNSYKKNYLINKMKHAKAYLFGLNYSKEKKVRLQGCINDVNNMGKFLKDKKIVDKIEIYTDESNLDETSASGMKKKINEISKTTWKEKLKLVWIHYSGHGTSILDKENDEKDGKDECLVPWDYTSAGVIKDDDIRKLLATFNPVTRIVLIFDCCNSGTMGDLNYSWKKRIPKVENIQGTILSPVISISGCLDNQTSADAYNVDGSKQYTGALTSCLLIVLNKNYKSRLFDFVEQLENELKKKGFQQRPKLCSSFKLSKKTSLFVD